MGVDCRKCQQFNAECDPAEDSYEQYCEDFKPVVNEADLNSAYGDVNAEIKEEEEYRT